MFGDFGTLDTLGMFIAHPFNTYEMLHEFYHNPIRMLGVYSYQKDVLKIHKLLFRLSWEEFCKYFYRMATGYATACEINFVLSLARLHYPNKIPDGLTADFVIPYKKFECCYESGRTFADVCDDYKATQDHKATYTVLCN